MIPVVDLERIKAEAIRGYDNIIKNDDGIFVNEANTYGVERFKIINHIKISMSIYNELLIRIYLNRLSIKMWKPQNIINMQMKNDNKIFLRYGKSPLDATLVLKKK